MSYQQFIRLNEIDFHRKKIIIIGAGWMADQYCKALHAMGIRSVTAISRTEESARKCCAKYDYQPRHGGYRDVLPKSGEADLVIIATPVHELKPAAEFAVALGYKNILVEKPGALFSEDLAGWENELKGKNVRVRIAYNRLTYPNYVRLKEIVQSEGGITSCRYTFTELIHSINFQKDRKGVYERWGISNSLHVISMVHDLIGMPEELNARQFGHLDWHPAGDRFAGSGITEFGIPFSYHADWSSAGRWSIEVMTAKNAYRLMPLEEIYRCKKGAFVWERMDTAAAYPDVKQGIAEEIAIMLLSEMETDTPLISLDKAVSFTRLTETIFNYNTFRATDSVK
jgi:predicted dehydrogenase